MIDKKRLVMGEKGLYCDISLIETPNSKYGDDYMIVQKVSKEEWEAGIRGAILGNAKKFGEGSGGERREDVDDQGANEAEEPEQSDEPDESASDAAPEMDDDDIPF